MKALVSFARTDTGLDENTTTLVQANDLTGAPLDTTSWALTELGQGLYLIDLPAEVPGSEGVFTIYPDAQPTHVYDGQISPDEDWFTAKSVWRTKPSYIDDPTAPLADYDFETIAKTAGFALDKVGIIEATGFAAAAPTAPADAEVTIFVRDLTTLVETEIATVNSGGISNDPGWVAPLTGVLRFQYVTAAAGPVDEWTFELEVQGGPQFLAGASPVRTLTVRVPATAGDVNYSFMLDDNGNHSLSSRGLGRWFQRDEINTGKFKPRAVWDYDYIGGRAMGEIGYQRPSNFLALCIGSATPFDETTVSVDFRVAPVPTANNGVRLGFANIQEMYGGIKNSTTFAIWDGAAWTVDPGFDGGVVDSHSMLMVRFDAPSEGYAGGIWSLVLPAGSHGVGARTVYVNIPPITGETTVDLFFGPGGEALSLSSAGFAAFTQPAVVEAEQILQRTAIQYGEDPNARNLGEQIAQIRDSDSATVSVGHAQGISAVRIRGVATSDIPDDFLLAFSGRKLNGVHVDSDLSPDDVPIATWDKLGGLVNQMTPGDLDNSKYRLFLNLSTGTGPVVGGAVAEIDIIGADGVATYTAVVTLPKLGTGTGSSDWVGSAGVLLHQTGRGAFGSLAVAHSTVQALLGSGFDASHFIGLNGVTDFTFKAGTLLTNSTGSATILAYHPSTGEKTVLYTITNAGPPVKDGGWVAPLPRGSLLLVRTNAAFGLTIDMDSVGAPLPYEAVGSGTFGTIRVTLFGAGNGREYLVSRDGGASELLGGHSTQQTTAGDILGSAPGLNWSMGVPARDHNGEPLATEAKAHKTLAILAETFLMAANGWHKDSLAVSVVSPTPPDPANPTLWAGVEVSAVDIHGGGQTFGVFKYRWDPQDPVPAWTLVMDDFTNWPVDGFIKSDSGANYCVRVDVEGDFPEVQFDLSYSAARGGIKTHRITVPAVTTGFGTEYLTINGFIDAYGNVSLRGVPVPASVPTLVWGAPSADNDTVGTMGGKLETINVNTAGGAGGGSILFTWTEYISGHEGDPDYAIPDVTVVVYNNDSAVGTPIASGVTDEVGAVEFYLDAGTYYLFRRKAGRRFINPETIAVS